jgi:hypothetical protein
MADDKAVADILGQWGKAKGNPKAFSLKESMLNPSDTKDSNYGPYASELGVPAKSYDKGLEGMTQTPEMRRSSPAPEVGKNFCPHCGKPMEMSRSMLNPSDTASSNYGPYNSELGAPAGAMDKGLEGQTQTPEMRGKGPPPLPVASPNQAPMVNFKK